MNGVWDSTAAVPPDLLQRPWDRKRWSVFADQLIEEGNPRGEAIALELFLDSASPSDHRICPMEAKLERQSSDFDKSWVGYAREVAERCACPMTLRRTFPGSLTLSGNEWDRLSTAYALAPIVELGLKHYARLPFDPPSGLFEQLEVLVFTEALPPRVEQLATPHLRELKVYDVAGNFRYPFAARLEALELNAPLPASTLMRLTDDVRLQGLKSLCIEPQRSGWFGSGSTELWKTLGSLPLENLEVRVNGPRGLKNALVPLASSRLREALGALHVFAGKESAKDLETLFSPPWPRLRKLFCGFENVDRASVFAGAKGLLHLQDLTACDVDRSVGEALAAAPLPHLRALDVSLATLDGIRALLDARWIEHVRRLDLSLNELGPGLGGLLAACNRLTSLTHLKLSSSDLSVGIEALTQAQLPSIEALDLLPDRESSALLLSRLPQLPWRLQELKVTGTRGLAEVLSSPAVQRLRRLQISGVGTIDSHVAHRLIDVESLVRLDLEDVEQVTPPVREALENRFGPCISMTTD